MNLTEPQLRSLIGFFHHRDPADVSVLGGRISPSMLQLDGIGSVVIKHYHRGGLVRYFIKRHYLKLGKTRAQREFELLHHVDNLGISVPQPVAYAYRGRLFYLAWLVTRAIKEPVSLVSLSLQDEGKARAAVQSTAAQIALLIQNKILHVDLHPGNVVVDTEGKVYLLDFDKGTVYHGSRQKLKDRYVARWQRAVVKHRLPEMLSEALRTGLQNNHM
ncbi:MAG: phosphotransferase [Desulfobacterales bacterium]|nr:MAG: phosphotransferase [Desulfobacterales bacterium]